MSVSRYSAFTCGILRVLGYGHTDRSIYADLLAVQSDPQKRGTPPGAAV